MEAAEVVTMITVTAQGTKSASTGYLMPLPSCSNARNASPRRHKDIRVGVELSHPTFEGAE